MSMGGGFQQKMTVTTPFGPLTSQKDMTSQLNL